MSKLQTREELLPLRLIRPVLFQPLLPIMNAVLNMLPHPMGRNVRVSKHLITPGKGEAFSATVIEPPMLRRPAPCLIFYHGGAFMLEAAPHHYVLAKRLAQETSSVVILPKYRLAPRHPFPGPVEDCFAAYEWALANAAMLGVDPGCIAVGGDSAGGNLAAVVCLMARDREISLPCFQMLLYPVIDRRMESSSMRAYQKTPMWNARLNKKMWKAYLPDSTTEPIWYASPIETPSLTGLPDTYLEMAELDPLRDEGIAYAEALQSAGVNVEMAGAKGVFHGYDLMKNSSIVKQCLLSRAAALKRAFS